MSSKKTVNKKLNKKKCFILLLLIYLICSAIYTGYKEPIKNIIITGNTIVKDVEIIESAGIEDYPSIFSITSRTLEKRIKELNFIESVKVKKRFWFTLKIEVEEAKLLFLNNSNNKLVLSNGEFIDNHNNYEAIPTLINYTPEDILKDFTTCLSYLDEGIISLISEIEYSIKKSEEGKTIDDTSFVLYMNDGNTINTNTSKCKNLSYYREIYASLNDKKGTLNLDSGNYENFVFIPYGG